MPPADFFTFLHASLSRMAAEEPDVHRSLAAMMDNLRARLVADGDARIIRFDVPGWRICAGTSEVDLEVAFDRKIIMDLIEGRLTMEDAIYQERLRVHGAVDSIERFHDALLIYLEGLIRTPGAAAMLENYRNA
jgi:hypothetical protein